MELKPFPTWEEATEGITDSRFVGHTKIPLNNTASTQDGARIMYDRLYMMLADPFRVSVDLERLKKLFPYYCDDCRQQRTCNVPICTEENSYDLVNKTIPTDRDACHAHLLVHLEGRDGE